jgi:uncharacterized protein YndB with AHSA1/START domain
MLPYVIGGAAAVLAGLAAVIARRPSAYRIERSTTIGASPEHVLPLIEDFAQWSRWSPWDKMDPTQLVTLSGAPRGIGAVYEWTGKKNGQGRMEIIEHRPGESVAIKLDFIKPFPSTSRCDFVVTPEGASSRVAWVMTGSNAFAGKAFDFFANMDRMLGRDFEAGLASMKAAAEADARG